MHWPLADAGMRGLVIEEHIMKDCAIETWAPVLAQHSLAGAGVMAALSAVAAHDDKPRTDPRSSSSLHKVFAQFE